MFIFRRKKILSLIILGFVVLLLDWTISFKQIFLFRIELFFFFKFLWQKKISLDQTMSLNLWICSMNHLYYESFIMNYRLWLIVSNSWGLKPMNHILVYSIWVLIKKKIESSGKSSKSFKKWCCLDLSRFFLSLNWTKITNILYHFN